MHCILGNAVSLRMKVLVQPMNAEAARRVAKAVPHNPSQSSHLRNPVSLDHVPKQYGVHITL